MGAVTAVASLGVTIAAAIWRQTFGRLLRWVYSGLKYLDPQRGIKEQLKLIMKELRPNGGTSLTDKVNVLVGELTAVRERQGVVAANTAMLLDESPSLLWRSDTNGRQVWSSKALIEASGRPASELLGMGWVNVIHGADQRRIRETWQSCIVEERNFEAECRFATPDGKVMHGRLVAKPFHFDGVVIGWIGSATLTPPPAKVEGETPKRPARARR